MKLLRKIIAWFRSKKTKTPTRVETNLSYTLLKIADKQEYDYNERILSKAKLSSRKSADEVYVVPLVFHIIHKGEQVGQGTNISDAQIHSAVNEINSDFAKEVQSRGDADGVSIPMRFQLMNKDDQGNPSTGIYRINGAALSATYAEKGIRGQTINGELESTVKNWSRQNNQHAYNVWIVSEIDNNNGGSGVNGYAYFPTISMVDGIVQLYNATGVRPKNWDFTMGSPFILKSYTKTNAILTHEASHGWAIRHTFDLFSCVDAPQDVLDKNYMSYAPEWKKNMFAACQRDRAILVCQNTRTNLLNSNALDNLQTIEATATMNIVSPNEIVCPETENYLKILVTNTSSNPIHKIRFAYTIGQTEYVKDWYGAISPQGVYGNDTIGLERLSLTENETDISVSITHINDNPYDVYDSAKVIVPTNEPYRIEINQDILAGQIRWDITRVSDMQVIYQSPDYNNFNPNEIIQHNLCLPDGYYNFTLIDVQAGMQTEGAYIRLLDPQGNILLNAADGFSQLEKQFFVGKKSPDLNNDGMVNIADISKMMLHFGTVLGDPNFDPKVDLNSDDQINILDLSILLKDFNTEIESKKVH